MQAGFPATQPIRCRSSTNNEDLPGFNGAGLYDSKTQHPDEGHVSKSIKQVYASLWNLRAFEERDYYRIDHFVASMGVLCHPNYEEEKANGVGVSLDPLYGTEGTFYLNSQVGEDLITNPEGALVPEEILLERQPGQRNGHILVQRSSLTGREERVIGAVYLEAMREYMSVIHDEFARLYDVVDDPSFAMDIEYKITVDDRLIVKQARPWVSFAPVVPEQHPDIVSKSLFIYPNPAPEFLFVSPIRGDITRLVVMDVLGRPYRSLSVPDGEAFPVVRFSLDRLPAAGYLVAGLNADGKVVVANRFIHR